MAPGNLRFGTGGLRAVMGNAPGQMNAGAVRRASRAVLKWLGGRSGLGVAVGYDSRHNSRAFALAAAAVFSRGGAPVYLMDRPAPSPLIAFAVRRLRLAAGVVITASHNPPQYNGYKVYGEDGGQILEQDAARIAGYMARDRGPDACTQYGRIRPLGENVVKDYLHVCGELAGNAAGLPPIKVVYTPLSGAAGELVCRALSRIEGVELFQVPRQARPDGDFPACPQPNPEKPRAFALAIRRARKVGADIALATDPDGDRAALAAPDRNGRWRVFHGDEAGVLLLKWRLTRWRGPAHPLIVKTRVTTRLTLAIAQAHGAQVVQVPTGFKHIGGVLKRLERCGQLDRFAFAFEESCGCLADARVRDKDGVQGCVMLCALARRVKAQGLTMDQALEALYRRYGYVLTSLCVWPAARPQKRFLSLAACAPPKLLGRAVRQSMGPAGLRLSAGPVAIVLRASGTEPLVKAYFSAKGGSRREAEDNLRALRREINRWIGAKKPDRPHGERKGPFLPSSKDEPLGDGVEGMIPPCRDSRRQTGGRAGRSVPRRRPQAYQRSDSRYRGPDRSRRYPRRVHRSDTPYEGRQGYLGRKRKQ